MYVLSHNGATKWMQNKFQTFRTNKVYHYVLEKYIYIYSVYIYILELLTTLL